MTHHLIFEVGLALAIIAAAALLSGRLRLSVAPLLILAGMAVGPHMPQMGIIDLRFQNSGAFIDFLGRLGILLLLFYLGLEFSVGRLVRAGRSIVVGGTIYMLVNLPLGIGLPWLLGWPFRETLVAAGIMVISSSAIVAKVLVDLKRTANPETELILGIMMYQDVFIAVYLSVISGLILSGATSLAGALLSAAVALGFMLVFLFLGRRLVPWLNRAMSIPSDESFLLVLFAVLLLVAGFSETIHVAEAIGALLLGLVLAETEHRERIEHLIIPFRDLFGAFFFFSFGLSIDPLALGGAVVPAVAAIGLTVIGNFVAGFWAGRSARLSHRAAANVGITVMTRGEFSIVLAGLAKAGGLLAVVQPFAALYVLCLVVGGPLLTRESRRIFQALNAVFRWQKARPAPAPLPRQ